MSVASEDANGLPDQGAPVKLDWWGDKLRFGCRTLGLRRATTNPTTRAPGQRTYSSEFKLQVVPEALQSDGTDAEVARAYDVHPVTLFGWNTKLKETGPNAVGGSDEPKEKPDYEAPVEEAESLLSSRAS